MIMKNKWKFKAEVVEPSAFKHTKCCSTTVTATTKNSGANLKIAQLNGTGSLNC